MRIDEESIVKQCIGELLEQQFTLSVWDHTKQDHTIYKSIDPDQIFAALDIPKEAELLAHARLAQVTPNGSWYSYTGHIQFVYDKDEPGKVIHRRSYKLRNFLLITVRWSFQWTEDYVLKSWEYNWDKCKDWLRSRRPDYKNLYDQKIETDNWKLDLEPNQYKESENMAQSNTTTPDWIIKAEAFCKDEVGVEKIFHPNQKGRYEFSGVDDKEAIALFDNDGFVITTIADLKNHIMSSFPFPTGIKELPGYFKRSTFEALVHKVENIRQAVANSGKPLDEVSPDRYAVEPLTVMMQHKWEQQKHCCAICNAPVHIENDPRRIHLQNPMVKIARGMRDSKKKTYDFENTIIGHYSCILAKNAFSMEQVAEWRALVIEGTIIMPDESQPD